MASFVCFMWFSLQPFYNETFKTIFGGVVKQTKQIILLKNRLLC